MGSACVRWLHIGDLHASDEDGWGSLQRLATLIDQVEANVPRGALQFAFLPGDNANHGTPEQYRRINEVLARLSLTVFAIAGDHDFEPGDLTAFASLSGAVTRPTCVMLADRRALFLDIVSAGTGGPDFRLADRQVEWLTAQFEAVAKAGEAAPLVFMHAFPGDLADGGQGLAKMFADAGVAFVDTGHTHYNEVLNDGAVIYAATRSTGQVEEGPVGFSVAAVDGSTASWRFKAAGSPWPWVMITSPADERLWVDRAARDDRDGFTVRALVLGRDVIRVEVQIGDGDAVAMAASPGEIAMWRVTMASRPEDRQRIRVTAWGRDGSVGEDEILTCSTPPKRDAAILGSHQSTIGPWPDHGLLGTRLGPNANGRQW